MERGSTVQLSSFEVERVPPESASDDGARVDDAAGAAEPVRNEVLRRNSKVFESHTVQEPILSRALAAASRPDPDPVRRWAIAAIAVSALLVLSLAYSAYLLAPRLSALHGELESNGAQLQTWTQETSALKDRTKALEGEVQSLRHFIAKSAHEDVIFLKIMILKPNIDPALARTIALHVHKQAGLYEKDPNLVLAIMSVESDFNPKATSSVGALGLMQVMPQWKRVLGIEGDLTDVETSIRSGLQVLGFYTEMYKDLELVLTAYNRGPGPVDHALMKQKDPKNGYSAKVLAEYQKLKAMSVTGPR